MFNIEIASLVITIDNKYPYVEEKCKDYITTKENNTGITLFVTKERMQSSIDYKFKFDGGIIDFPEAEYDAIHYYLYEEIYKFNGFWLHSVLIEKDNNGYAFTAAPGVGKSTHAKLWLKAFDDAIIVNGDNTIVIQDKEDGIFYGYGTPFCGKEGYNKNTRVKLKAICFIERSNTNYVEEFNPMDAIMQMTRDNWCIRKDTVAKFVNLYLLLASQVKFYKIHCNMDLEAAKVVYEGISK